MNWHLYLLRTRTGSLYTGITTDIDRRIQQHVSGKGAKSLRGKGPLTLAFSCEVSDRSCAQKLEARVKKFSRYQKEALVSGGLSLDLLKEEITQVKVSDTP